MFFLFLTAQPMLAQATEMIQGPLTFVKGATYAGSEACLTCHEKEGRDCALSPHYKLNLKADEGGASQGCEMCHGPGSVHAENSDQKNNIINPRKDPRICFNCHADKKQEFRLPYHHPVMEGKISCSDCHDCHGPDITPSATSMEEPNQLCFKCHKDQEGPFVYEHAALREGCTVCHKVHGSIHEKMLLVRDANLCLRCHMQTNYSAGFIGAVSGHTSRMGETCYSGGCHTAVHGSNFDKALKY
ncbi:MAG: hypothetical protein HQL26_01985 [Candidatus Omnitrophica bacterium]|nr:hypothetical protein [Candidatus Omnitrophota bacterium]